MLSYVLVDLPSLGCFRWANPASVVRTKDALHHAWKLRLLMSFEVWELGCMVHLEYIGRIWLWVYYNKIPTYPIF